MRGLGVVLSPDSPGNDVVRPSRAREPRGKKNVLTTNYSYSQMFASGKPVPEDSALILKLLDPSIKPVTEDAEKAQKVVEKFQNDVGFAEKLGDYNFTEQDLNTIIEYVLKRLSYLHANTPFPVTEEIVKDIIRCAF
jgi:alcohol dehydrogenase class IV